MKEILFVIQLIVPGMAAPVENVERVPSLEACYERVAQMTQEFAKVDDEVFRFGAGCVIVSRKPPGDPT